MKFGATNTPVSIGGLPRGLWPGRYAESRFLFVSVEKIPKSSRLRRWDRPRSETQGVGLIHVFTVRAAGWMLSVFYESRRLRRYKRRTQA